MTLQGEGHTMADEVLVYTQQHNGKLGRPAWEALAAGQHLAADLGTQVAAVVLGHDIAGLVAELAEVDLQEVLPVDSPLLAEYTPDGYTQALREVIQQRQPRLVVFSHTYQARDFAPKLAASFGRGLASDCLGYRKEDGRLVFVRQVFQGKYCADIELSGEAPWFVSFQAATFREDSVARGATLASPSVITPASVSLTAESIRTKPAAPFREAKQAVDLTQAEIIITVGRGIKAPENLEMVNKLAAALGGEVGASRPICDNGWLPLDRQIGSSGQTVAPKLYVGVGVSGAIQHLVGMKGARTIVAINKDKEAPIFEVATYGIVGDLFEVVPPLIEEIQKVKG
jgi:electron transfer flavoprotein alpha subunit